MKILIEEHTYGCKKSAEATAEQITIASKVREILGSHYMDLESTDTSVHVSQVGYFYNETIEDCVFILPKVIMNAEDRVFAFNGREGYRPEDLIDFASDILQEDERAFLFELSVWIYRAISIYNERNIGNDNFVEETDSQMTRTHNEGVGNTMLDILLGLLDFYRKNQDYVFFVLRNIHSGYNKINWTKTITHSTAFIQNGNPIYLDVTNKKRQINFEEELLIIFYSILKYAKEKFGFPIQINVNFNLINGEMFENYRDGLGETRLLQIKYKYFSDKDLLLWNLCYAFFTKMPNVNTEHPNNDIMVVKKFNRVFEDIMDVLIGDEDIMTDKKTKKLKSQEGRRFVDHIFQYDDLILGNQKKVYFIGDSKYYSCGQDLSVDDIAKQYDYAHNVILWNIQYGKSKGHQPLKDSFTRGFNIIPNFFISAHQNTLEEDGKIVPKEKIDPRIFEPNSLFDHETLFVTHYDVNFLFVLSLYARYEPKEISEWGSNFKRQFRNNIIDTLNSQYKFYILEKKEGVDTKKVIKDNFYDLQGKVYQPEQDFFILALDRNSEFDADNKRILGLIGKDFNRQEYELRKS